MMLQAKDTFRGVLGCKFFVNGCSLQISFSRPTTGGAYPEEQGYK